MATEITMPQLSDTMHEGRILTWLKKEGESVRRGDALAEVATDKADLEIESFHEGVLLKIQAPVGTTVKVGSVIALVGAAGEAAVNGNGKVSGTDPNVTEVAPPVTQSYAKPAAQAPAPAAVTAPASASTPENNEGTGERIKISPLAKNVANAHGVDIAALSGTGEGGRIVRRDVERVIEQGRAAPAPANQKPMQHPGEAPSPVVPAARPSAPQPMVTQPAPQSVAPSMGPQTGGKSTTSLSRMRQTIADRMVESVRTIPHFFTTAKVDAAQLVALRETLKTLPQYEGLTYNHLIIKACGIALRAYPKINATFAEGSIIEHHSINIGIVTAVPDGLLIPVVKSADSCPLSDIVADARTLVQRARSGKPKPDDLVGGTFSVSNMGMFPVEQFSAIISPGQAAILAVSAISDEPVVKEGHVVPGTVLRLTLSVDHRILDGVMAGQFLAELKRLLETPVLLIA